MNWLGRRGIRFNMNGLMPTGRRSKSLMLFTAMAAFSVPAALAQTAPAAQQVGPAPGIPVIATPTQPSVAPAVPPAPPPLPPVMWDPVSAQDLIYYIQQIGTEGLNPADYDPEGLAAGLIDRSGGNSRQVLRDTEAALAKRPKVSAPLTPPSE